MIEIKDKIKAALLWCEPQTPTEIANKTGIDRRTVHTRLLELIIEENDSIGHKKIGPYYLFWLKK